MSKEVSIYLNGKELFNMTEQTEQTTYKVIKDYGDFVEADNGMLYWDSDDGLSGGQVPKDTVIGTMTYKSSKGVVTVYRSPNYHNIGYIYIDGNIYILSKTIYEPFTVNR